MHIPSSRELGVFFWLLKWFFYFSLVTIIVYIFLLPGIIIVNNIIYPGRTFGCDSESSIEFIASIIFWISLSILGLIIWMKKNSSDNNSKNPGSITTILDKKGFLLMRFFVVLNI